jgi:hypothetical protein
MTLSTSRFFCRFFSNFKIPILKFEEKRAILQKYTLGFVFFQQPIFYSKFSRIPMLPRYVKNILQSLFRLHICKLNKFRSSLRRSTRIGASPRDIQIGKDPVMRTNAISGRGLKRAWCEASLSFRWHESCLSQDSFFFKWGKSFAFCIK